MRKSCLAVVLILVLFACDPGKSITFRVVPSPSVQANSALAARDSIQAAGAAVGRLALHFGLPPYPEKPVECEQAWLISGYPRGNSQRALGNLFLCTVTPADGTLEVRLSETLTTRWSPKGDSVRRALADTLTRFGRVGISGER
jgi:hypothetical protein